jgi:hypothetical protein
MSSTRRTETGQVHLDQRFFDRALAPPVALDDRRLEGLPAELRHPERHFAGPGVQLAWVSARPDVAARLRPLVAGRVAQPIRLRLEQAVQRLLDRATDDLAEVVADPLVVDPHHVAQPASPNNSPDGC